MPCASMSSTNSATSSDTYLRQMPSSLVLARVLLSWLESSSLRQRADCEVFIKRLPLNNLGPPCLSPLRRSLLGNLAVSLGSTLLASTVRGIVQGFNRYWQRSSIIVYRVSSVVRVLVDELCTIVLSVPYRFWLPQYYGIQASSGAILTVSPPR